MVIGALYGVSGLAGGGMVGSHSNFGASGFGGIGIQNGFCSVSGIGLIVGGNLITHSHPSLTPHQNSR